jgi:hypothetical protein
MREFLSLQLEGTAEQVLSPDASLELIPCDCLNIRVGVAISLPPIYSDSKQLVCRKKNFCTVGTLGFLQLLLNWLQPVLCIHGILG